MDGPNEGTNGDGWFDGKIVDGSMDGNGVDENILGRENVGVADKGSAVGEVGVGIKTGILIGVEEGA